MFRRLLIFVLCVVAIGFGPAATPVSLADDTPGTSDSPSLKDMLEKGLRARRPEEFAFLDHVVKMVHQGKLPEDLVKSTFLWARNKGPYPYEYFEHGLRLRAKELGIEI